MSQLKIERIDAVAVVTITPERDFMTTDTVDDLITAVETLAGDASCRGIVFTGGRPGVFIRHYDVDELQAMSDQLRDQGLTFSESRLMTRERAVDRLFNMLGAAPKITIAAINGFAMGGGFEFTLACDLRIAADGDFHMGLPEINIGLLPGAGGTQRLARLIGPARALEMVARGGTVPPREALALGLVHEVCDTSVLDRAIELAREYAGKPPVAFNHIKRLIREATDRPLDEALTLERTLFLDCLVSDDANRLMTKMNTESLDIRDVGDD